MPVWPAPRYAGPPTVGQADEQLAATDLQRYHNEWDAYNTKTKDAETETKPAPVEESAKNDDVGGMNNETTSNDDFGGESMESAIDVATKL